MDFFSVATSSCFSCQRLPCWIIIVWIFCSGWAWLLFDAQTATFIKPEKATLMWEKKTMETQHNMELACKQGFLHFSKILDIGLDINAWHCTHTENTFALTRSSSIWKSVAMSEALRLSQDKRCESWITDEDLCDAVAFVGPERQRVPFLRAPLATLSKPLKVALYGDWVVSSNVSLFHSFPIRFWGLWPLF